MSNKLDHTALSTLDRCEQEYVYRHVKHLRAAATDPSAHFGQIIHLGVRGLYDGKSMVDTQLVMREAWTLDSTAKPHLTLDRAYRILTMYADQWLANKK